MMVKAIFFDLDDTLYPYKDSNSKIKAELKAIEYFCSKHKKCDLAEMFADFTKIKQHIKQEYLQLPARGDRMLWITEFLKHQKKYTKEMAEDMLNLFWNVSCENASPFYDAEVALKYLKKKGYKLGVITNGLKEIQNRRLKAIGLNKYFKVVVTTSEVGYEKPNTAAFKLAMKKLKVQAKDSVMIGDNPPRDILPANKLGMTSVWLRRGKRYYYPATGKEIPKHEIKSLVELMQLF